MRLLSSLLHFLDSLRTYPAQHVHSQVSLQPLSATWGEYPFWYPQSWLLVCEVCDWTEVR